MTEWLSGFMCGIIAMYYGRRWYLRAEMRRLEAFKADLVEIANHAARNLTEGDQLLAAVNEKLP